MKNAEAPVARAEIEKESRTRAMARPRLAERNADRNYMRRRRSSPRSPVNYPYEPAPVSALRAYWDAHAIKTGMAVFWTWFIAANWGNLVLVAQDFIGF